MKLIPLNNGYFSQVDDEDYEMLMQFKWVAKVTKNGIYARRNKGSPQYMHCFIKPASKGLECDHKDRNPLNNQKYNIRHCTHQQNCCNRRHVYNKSGYHGVSWHKKGNKWQAHLTVAGKPYYLGIFTAKEDAARARDRMAIEKLGEFAILNFPLETYTDLKLAA